MGLWEAFLNWLRSLFFKQEMELSLIGLQNAGKTSLVNVVATGGYSEDMIPTVGFNMRKVTKGNVTIKLWDLGGQPRFRSMWERYCRAVSAIVYVVDAADPDNLNISKSELHDLLSKSSLNGIPLLVLGNKIDKDGALSKQALTDQMDLKSITDRESPSSHPRLLFPVSPPPSLARTTEHCHFRRPVKVVSHQKCSPDECRRTRDALRTMLVLGRADRSAPVGSQRCNRCHATVSSWVQPPASFLRSSDTTAPPPTSKMRTTVRSLR
ncbi:unnamed protein product [Lactuca saligna]|uniref:ADP-ribosylation factor-like protein 8B n=1 Tax=Lactuca saligna TaxID=75948 RepID=A0AA36DZU1_LACSI|nr:unnamed protein product [Lactuca saligna]